MRGGREMDGEEKEKMKDVVVKVVDRKEEDDEKELR